MSRTLVRLLALGAAIAALFLATGAGAAPTTDSSGDISLDVPDGGMLTLPVINVSTTGLIADVNVSVLLKEDAGGNLSDIDLALVGPDSTRVNLALDKGGLDSDFGSGSTCAGPLTTFDDQALTPISTALGPSFDGSFQPIQALNAFNGKPANGPWHLEIADSTSGGNLAKLLCWKITISLPSSDLQVTLTDSQDPSFVNQDLTYTATVKNAGPDASGPSTLKFTIPSGVTLKSVASSAAGAVCTPAEAKCDLGPLANGATADVTAVVTPSAAGSIDVKAEVTPTDAVPGNNSATAATQISDGTGGTETVTITTKGAGHGVVTSDPAGLSCGLTCTAGFVKGAKITLTTEPADGSVFKSWGGVCEAFAADSPCTLKADGDVEVIATFAKAPTSGSGGSSGESGGTGSGSATGSKFFACTITGNVKANVLRGTKKRDVICGLGGNDKIYGLGGNDVLIGGPGKDTLFGGPGKDEIYASDSFADTIYGGAGKDSVSVDLKDSFFDVESFAL